MDKQIKLTIHHDDPDGVSTDFVVRNRTLLHKSFENLTGLNEQLTLERIDKELGNVVMAQSPKDYTDTLNNIQVIFKKGEMRANYKNMTDMRFLTSGASQLAQLVLPAYHWRGLKQLTLIPPKGEFVATEAWNHFASMHNKKQYVVRCVRIRNPDKSISPVIRAIVSPTYGLYSNQEFVQDMKYVMADYPIVPILAFTLTDQAMRINFVGADEFTTFIGYVNREMLDMEPLPIVSAWNSEVGRGKIGLRAGLYNPNVNGAMGHWDNSTEFTWIHRGGANGLNLRSNVAKAFTEVMNMSRKIVDLYRKSRDMEITADNIEQWIKEQFVVFDTLPNSFTQLVIQNLKSPKVTPGTKLATILDAMMLASSAESDMFRKADIERATASLMYKMIENK